MKKNAAQNPTNKWLNVKEISEGVYINLNRITTDEKEFDKAIEESFKELDKQEAAEKSNRKSPLLNRLKNH
jgi:hypothetical protein